LGVPDDGSTDDVADLRTHGNSTTGAEKRSGSMPLAIIRRQESWITARGRAGALVPAIVASYTADISRA
jgi:hypothetical protein